MATACRFAAPLGLAPLHRSRSSAAGAKSVAFSIGSAKAVRRNFVVKAASGGEGPAETPEIVKAAQDAWAKVEDKYAVATIGVAGLVALWTAVGALKAIDKLSYLAWCFRACWNWVHRGKFINQCISCIVVPFLFFLRKSIHMLTSFITPKRYCFVLMQWFTYRNLIFQPDREALISNIKSTYNEITGSSS